MTDVAGLVESEIVTAVVNGALAADDMLRRYEDAIAGLPDRTRTIFLLHRADDLTYRQIARRLGVTLWTVEYHMKRAIVHLGRMLDDQ